MIDPTNLDARFLKLDGTGEMEGDIKADTDNAHDIGATGARFKDLYLSGNITDDTVSKAIADLVPYTGATGAVNLGAQALTTSGVITGGAIVSTSDISINPLTLGSILFVSTSGLISQDNSNLFWDYTNKRLGVGKTPTQGTLDVEGQIYAKSRFDLRGADGGTPYFVEGTYSNTSWHANFFILQRARGTYASKVAVVSGDNVMRYTMKGWDGSAMVTGAEIRSKVDGTVSTGIVPMQFVYRTMNAAGTLADRMIIKPSGRFGFNVSSPAAMLHIDQSSATGAIPVLTLDQADVSDGFINFIGSDRGIITGATDSAVSVRVELGGTVYRLALYADA